MDRKRAIYILACVVILAFWLAFGTFEAAEAPYVRF
jgi:hypothetical protein